MEISNHEENFSKTCENLIKEIVVYIKNNWFFDGVLVYIYNEQRRTVDLHTKSYKQDEFLRDKNVFSVDNDNVFSLSFKTGELIHIIEGNIVAPEDFSANQGVYCSNEMMKQCVILPSFHNNKKNGIFVLFNKTKKENFGEGEVDSLKSFVNSISGIIEILKNKYIFEELKKSNNRIIELIKKINSTVDLNKLLDLLLQEINNTVGFDGCFIAIADSLKENLIFEKIQVPEKYIELATVMLKTSITLSSSEILYKCFSECKVLQIDESSIDNYVYDVGVIFDLWKTKYMTFVPFAKNKQSIGVIIFTSVKSCVPDKVVSKLWKILELFYEQVKNAEFLKRIREMETDTEIHAERNRKIFEIVQNTNGLKSTREIYKIILNELLNVFGFDIGFIFMRENNILDYKYGSATKSKYKKILDKFESVVSELDGLKLIKELGALQFSFLNNTHIYFPELSKILHLPMTEQDRKFRDILQGIKSMMLFPIILKQKPIGIIQLCSLNQSVYLNPGDIKLVKTISPLIGNSISTAKLYSKLEAHVDDLTKQREFLIKLSYSDQLTGIRNRRYFEQRVIDEYKKFKRYAEPIFIFMMDLDDFKTINDTYGHEAGDIVLKNVVTAINEVIRESDLFARYGGEEFVILAIKTDKSGAKVLAKKIIHTIQSLKVMYKEIEINLTISIGISYLTKDSSKLENVNELINMADNALYNAKRKGKNTFCFYE